MRGQNGIIRRKIGKITVGGQIMLPHTKSFWPEAIKHMIYPFAVAKAIRWGENFDT